VGWEGGGVGGRRGGDGGQEEVPGPCTRGWSYGEGEGGEADHRARGVPRAYHGALQKSRCGSRAQRGDGDTHLLKRA
jgi:hypothetical protein